MGRYVTIADFGEWSVVEEIDSELTNIESEKILEYCTMREKRNRKRIAARKAKLNGIFSGLAFGICFAWTPAIMFLLWCYEIGY